MPMKMKGMMYIATLICSIININEWVLIYSYKSMKGKVPF